MKEACVRSRLSSRSLILLLLAVPCAVALCVTGCGSSSSSSSSGGVAGAEAGAAGVSDRAGEAGALGEGEGGAGEGGANEAGAGPVATTEEEMFSALGVDTTSTQRTYLDRKGKLHTLGDGYNPLGRGVKSLQPLSEVYVAGRSVAGSAANQFLLDNAGTVPAKTSLKVTDPTDSWAGNTFTHSLPGDLDGDGVDEIVNVYYIESSKELHANVIRCTSGCAGDGGEFTNVKDTKLTVQDATKLPLDRDWFSHGMLFADVDGDGHQELVIANFGGIDVCVPSAAFAFSCTPRVTSAFQNYSLARGHLDDDPEKTNDDIVATWGDGSLAYVGIYDGSPDSFAANAYTSATHDPTPLSIKFVGQTQVTNYIEAFVETGDIDLDGRDEIVISAKRTNGSAFVPYWHDLILMDDAQVSFRFYRAFQGSLGPDGGSPIFSHENNAFHPALKVFTKRTQPVYEKAIYAGAYVFDRLTKLLPSDTTAFPNGQDLTNELGVTYMGYYENGGGNYNHAPNEVVVGDIDGSGQDSVVAFWDTTLIGSETAYPQSTLARFTWDAGASQWTPWANIVATTGGNAQITGNYDLSYGVGLALPNVDRDSPIVEYRGQHEVLFSTPRVLAVLAAAPFFDGENGENSSTSISLGSGTGLAAESTIGLRTGTSIGYEAPNLFGTSKFETKLTFGFAMDWISSTQVTLEQTQTWTAGNEDAVVFQVIPFDVYYYKVLSSPDPADFDKPLSINVPRKLNTYKVPVELYNRSIVDGPSIGPALISHTVGDPASYPKKNACAQAPAGGSFGDTSFLVDAQTWCYASADVLHVGVGKGSVGFTIARTETSSEGTSTDLSVDFEVVAGVGGLSFGQSVGFHWGYGYTVDTTQSYNFSGQVGDLSSSKHGYDFGLMAHRGVLSGLSTDYPVFLVDYWVENVE